MHSSLHLVVGLGKTGHSIARYLQRRNIPFCVFDTRQAPGGLAEFKMEFPGVDVFLHELPENVYKQLSGIICSPGVALDEPAMQKAFDMAVPIYGDIECLAREVQAPIIAITGTNGKSTVTMLVGEMAKSAGLSVAVGGNIGTPVLDLLDDEVVYDLWVLELSSFQLALTTSLTPIAATILNITPDHLDRHHNFTAYVQAKHRAYNHANVMVYNREDSRTYPDVNDVRPSTQLTSFGLDNLVSGGWGLLTQDNIIYLAFEQEILMPVDALRIKGRHNWSNALAACSLASAAGIPFSCMIEVLKKFPGLPHRSQWVRTLDGVDWINDSKGTNIGATVSAISGIGVSMEGKIVLIAGGQGKGADFSELCASMTFVRSVVLIGEDADKIELALKDAVPVQRAPSMDEAINLAQRKALIGDVVLLSPACASLDMFRDFNHRGEVFTAVVNAL